MKVDQLELKMEINGLIATPLSSRSSRVTSRLRLKALASNNCSTMLETSLSIPKANSEVQTYCFEDVPQMV